MDRAIAEQFGPDHFVTAQMMRLTTGRRLALLSVRWPGW